MNMKLNSFEDMKIKKKSSEPKNQNMRTVRGLRKKITLELLGKLFPECASLRVESH